MDFFVHACTVWILLPHHVYHKRWWCDAREPKGHFPQWAVYGNVIRENKGVHQSHIHNLWNPASGHVKKCLHGTSSTSDENPTMIQQLGFRAGEVFQDKAVIKNEWLFATNTVAPESFMGHVMEKYEGTHNTGKPLPGQTFMLRQDSGKQMPLNPTKPPVDI